MKMNEIECSEYDEIAWGYNTIWPNLAQGDHVSGSPLILFISPVPIL